MADSKNHRIRQFMPGATTSTLAGSAAGHADGFGTVARFDAPTALALDVAGRLFVAEMNGNCIRMVLPDGTTSTIAGTGVAGNRGDGGPAFKAQFNQPMGLALDDKGNLYVADRSNHRVRRITLIPQAPITPSTVAGSGQATVSCTAGGAG